MGVMDETRAFATATQVSLLWGVTKERSWSSSPLGSRVSILRGTRWRLSVMKLGIGSISHFGCRLA